MNQTRAPRFELDDLSNVPHELQHTVERPKPMVDESIYVDGIKRRILSNEEIERRRRGNTMVIESITASIDIGYRLSTDDLYGLHIRIGDSEYRSEKDTLLITRRRTDNNTIAYMIYGFSPYVKHDDPDKPSKIICSGSKTVEEAKRNLKYEVRLLNGTVKSSKEEKIKSAFVTPLDFHAQFNNFKVVNYKASIRYNARIKLQALFDDLYNREDDTYSVVYSNELGLPCVKIFYIQPYKFTFMIFASGYITVFGQNVDKLDSYWETVYNMIKSHIVLYTARLV